MNDAYRDVKARLRKLDELLADRGANMDFAQALSQARRLARKGDRSREPSMELRACLERAENLSRRIS